MTAFLDSWPRNITEEELLKYPKFSSLLLQLREKLASNGASQNMEKKLDLAKRNLSKARYHWLLNHISYYELNELLTDLEVKGQQRTLTADEKQFQEIFRQTLAYIEIGDYLHLPSSQSSRTTLFGLTSADVDRLNPVKSILPDFQQIVLQMLEDRLRKKVTDLYSFYDPIKSQESGSEHLLSAKAASLPKLIEQRKEQLHEEQMGLKGARAMRDKQFWTYYQQLLESLSVLETMINNFKLTHQAAMDDAQIQYLIACCEALCLKVRLNRVRVLVDTYTADTVQALRKVGNYLDAAIKETEADLTATSHSLQAYHGIGTEFRKIVEEYTKIKKEIETIQWGLRVLKNEIVSEEAEDLGDHKVTAQSSTQPPGAGSSSIVSKSAEGHAERGLNSRTESPRLASRSVSHLQDATRLDAKLTLKESKEV